MNVDLYNNWTNQFISKQFFVNLLDNKAPIVTGMIRNVTAFRNQMMINITIPSDLFYDPDDTISTTILPCTSNNVGVSEYINFDSLKSKVIAKLASNFIGAWEVTLVGYDSISQGVKTSFYINGKITLLCFINQS